MGCILVIDDDEQLRKLIRRTLEKDGHTVDELGDGRRALELYRDKHYDVVITDIIMPEKEGIETIIELRNEFPDANIIAMSGGGRISPVDCLNMAENLGARCVISKPFDRKKLLEEVQAITP